MDGPARFQFLSGPKAQGQGLLFWKGASKSVHVLASGIQAAMVLTLRHHIPSTTYYIPYAISHILYSTYSPRTDFDKASPERRSRPPLVSAAGLEYYNVQGFPMGPWYWPLPSLEGYELWAPILKMVYNDVLMALYKDSELGARPETPLPLRGPVFWSFTFSDILSNKM